MFEDLVAFTPQRRYPLSVLMSGISYCDGSYSIRRPDSSLYCFEYIYKGRGTVCPGSERFTAKAGDIYILPAKLDHYYYSDPDDPWTKIWFNISGDLIEKLLESYQIKHLFHIEGLDLSALFERFLETARQPLPQEEMYQRCTLIFLEIVQRIASHVHALAAPQVPQLAFQLRRRLDDLTDFELPFSKLIGELYCTKAHAIRTFKDAYGITPYQYLLRKKLNLSKMMLENSQLSISEIASELRFKDSHYFSAFFKQHAGLSPQQYRKSVQGSAAPPH